VPDSHRPDAHTHPEFTRLAGQHDLPLLQHDSAVGVRKHGAVVAVHDQRGDARCANFRDDAPDLRDDEGCEPLRRLVEDQQARMRHQCTSDRKHLLFAS
jgi:hypothetical protein